MLAGKRPLSEAEMRQVAGLPHAELDVGSDLAGMGEKALDAEQAALAHFDAQCTKELRRIVLEHYPAFIAASQVSPGSAACLTGWHSPAVYFCS